jgi:hypothetical protein
MVSSRLSIDRRDLALCAVFVLAAAFYLWTADTTYPLALHNNENPYNQLASAFLHLRLYVSHAPPPLLRLHNPYEPPQNLALQEHYSIHDYALDKGRLYLTWGPAPVLVLLVPMRLLGLEPSSSLVTCVYAIAGLGFALAILRVILRQLGGASAWMCVAAACTLAFASVVPFILRRPAVYEEAIAGGYCFAMAGIWLATVALVDRSASLRRLALMSLCFGLAIGSRPTLGLTTLVLIPVYLTLRPTRARRGLLLALGVPVGACVLLLAVYNQSRFGSPVEFGTRYQLASYNSRTANLANPAYVLPGAWFYIASPPRPTVVFPFVELDPSPLVYPPGLPAGYTPEITAGLLPMAPIAIFLLALPWLWRRRPALLGPLAVPLLILAAAGLAALLFLSYEFFSNTERYEVDFATLLLLGALAAWLALCAVTRGYRRRLVQAGGALLAVWSCCTGLAISFTGYYDLLAEEHPGTWATLEELGSPLSTGLAIAAGHPVLAEVAATKGGRLVPARYTALGIGAAKGWLEIGAKARLRIVSPDARVATIAATLLPAVRTVGASVATGLGPAGLTVDGPDKTSQVYPVPPRGEVAHLPVRLNRGLNWIVLSPRAGTVSPASPTGRQVLIISDLSVLSRR